MKTRIKSRVISSITAVLVLSGLIPTAATVMADTTTTTTTNTTNTSANHVVISEIYAGGTGNDTSKAAYSHDFIELYNPTDEEIPLSGWSLQYATAKSSSWYVIQLGTKTPSIKAHGYYLIKMGTSNLAGGYIKSLDDSYADAIANNPTTADINKDGSKIALVKNTINAITTADPRIDTLSGNLVDLVGFGKGSVANPNATNSPNAYEGSGFPPDGSYQKTLVRKGIDPTSSNIYIPTSNINGYGNGLDTDDNINDFVILSGVSYVNPQNSQSPLEPFIQGSVDDNNKTVTIDTYRAVSSSDSSFTINLATQTGKIRAGALIQGTDYVLSGLPAGLTSTAIGLSDSSNNSITFEIGGTAAVDVLASASVSVQVYTHALNTPIYGDSWTIGGITLQPATPKVTAALTDTTVSMSSATAVSSADSSFAVQLSKGTIKDGLLQATDYSVIGLPSGLSIEATGVAAANTVNFRVYGTAAQPILNDVNLSVVLKKEAVTAGATQDSDIISGITLKRASAPLLTDTDRKNSVVNVLKQANAFHSDLYDKNYKYSEMRSSAFKFYRGNNPVFFQDLGTPVLPIPAAWKDWNQVDTWIEGDAHTRNVGFFDHNDGKPYFDVNDQDESLKAPFYFDLIRFIASIYVTKDDVSGTKTATAAETRQAAKDFLEQYKTTLESVRGNDTENTTVLDESFMAQHGFSYSGYMLKTFFGSSPTGNEGLLDGITNSSFLDGYSQVTDGQRKLKKIALPTDAKNGNEKVLATTPAEESELKANWSTYVNQTRLSSGDKASYFAIKDIGRVIEKGLGSIGVRRYFVLIEGPTSDPNDDIILNVKQQKMPAMVGNTYKPLDYSAYVDHDADRTKTAYDALSAVEDPFIGSLNGSAKTFLVRQLSAYDRDFNDKKFSSFADYQDFLKASAMAYAYTHARADRNLGYSFEDSVSTILNSDWSTIRDTMVNLGEDYAKQVVADYNQYKIVPNANLIDITDLSALTITGGTISPAFSSKQTSYTMSVGNSVYAMTVAPATIDPAATVLVNGTSYVGATPRTVDLAVGSNTVTVVVTAQDLSTKTYKITVNRDSSSGSGTGTLPAAPESTSTVEKGNTAVTTTTDVKSTLDSAGKATASLTSKQVTDALAKVADSQTVGKDSVLEIKTVVDSAAKEAVVSLPTEAFALIAGSKTDTLTLSAGLGKLSLDKQAIGAVQAAATSGTVDISIRKADLQAVTQNWTPAAKEALATAVNGRPVFDFTITAGGTKVSTFNGGSVEVQVPYKPSANEDPNAIVAYYIADNGELVKVTNSHYDAATGSLVFHVSHFSRYAVGYSPATFRDTAESFAKSYITYLAARNIINGTADGVFTPKAQISRADFTLMLARMAGVKLDAYKASSFSDVKADSYYAQSVQWASDNGLTSGVRAGEFAPGANITREQMVTMIARFAKLQKISLPQTTAAAAFADAAEIPAFAVDAAKAMQQAGIISGKSGNTFAPKDFASREEAAKMLGMVLQLSAK
ncbi:hypothetical protein A8709_20160 [Paenibacillus pectinilyticus]|uniref:DUF2252 domain-containing protein n=1 Tax=Paenibacillus pectinilyticus TaxID=512399 RepID=A0A1C0ZY65_9BACL|nr:DUF2252 family protein [Paenibacillus pectinilyticus]OCT13070.1 hypothetical protein A8709_20160 [Paenibacillus pectinilyticus]